MNQDKSRVIASSLGVSQRTIELLVDCGLFTEDEVESFLRRGIEQGKIKTVAQCRDKLRIENEKLEKTTNERINRQNMRFDVEFEMICASRRMIVEELLDGTSEEYRRGFWDAMRLQSDFGDAILNTK